MVDSLEPPIELIELVEFIKEHLRDQGNFVILRAGDILVRDKNGVEHSLRRPFLPMKEIVLGLFKLIRENSWSDLNITWARTIEYFISYNNLKGGIRFCLGSEVPEEMAWLEELVSKYMSLSDKKPNGLRTSNTDDINDVIRLLLVKNFCDVNKVRFLENEGAMKI